MSVLIILYFIFFICCSCTELLTKRQSQDWFANIEEFNKTNPFCGICCIEMQKKSFGKKCGEHTLCKYSNRVGAACRGYIPVYFTTSEKVAIIDAHNTFRNKVALGLIVEGLPGPQPSAANMRGVAWSDELAAVAERWAGQCIYGNDLCRDLEKFPVGQNIARGNFATNNDLTLISQWFAQVRFFNSSTVDAYDIIDSKYRSTKSYTQIVWADTYLIGCARSVFQVTNASKIYYREHLICNYGPTGNIPSQPIYKTGEACSRCPDSTACTTEYRGLCWPENVLEFKEYDDLISRTNRPNISTYLFNFFIILLIFY